MQSEPSVPRGERRLAQGLHFVGLISGWSLWCGWQLRGCTGLGSPGAQLAHVLCCPQWCFG